MADSPKRPPKLKLQRHIAQDNSQNSPPIGSSTGVGLTEEQRNAYRGKGSKQEQSVIVKKNIKGVENHKRRMSRGNEIIQRKKASMKLQRKTRRNKAASRRLPMIHENNEVSPE